MQRGIAMTEKEIMQYVALKKLIERRYLEIEKLENRDIDVVCGKVKGSSKQFPYTEIRTSVQMYEPKVNDKINLRIHEIKLEIEKANAKINKIEDFISNINDPELKVIFEMRVYEKLNWIDNVAELDIDKDRTTYSKKFKKYLENSHNSPMSQ